MAPFIFRQLFENETSTYTYILGDPVSKEALIIDPVLETVERDAKIIKELGLTLKYALNTHVHADHITGSGLLKNHFPDCKSCVAGVTGAVCDVGFSDGQVLSIGDRSITCLSTPGHTIGCTSFVTDDKTMVFTGDALFVRGCGRTDFQNGSSENLFNSIHTKIFTLPGETLIYPGHDYRGFTVSTVDEEKRLNPRLTKTLPDFIEFMANLKLDPPKKIDISVPANLRDGL